MRAHRVLRYRLRSQSYGFHAIAVQSSRMGTTCTVKASRMVRSFHSRSSFRYPGHNTMKRGIQHQRYNFHQSFAQELSSDHWIRPCIPAELPYHWKYPGLQGRPPRSSENVDEKVLLWVVLETRSQRIRSRQRVWLTESKRVILC